MTSDAERWADLLGKKDGSRAQKIAWLEEHLDLIAAEAEASFADRTPTPRNLHQKTVATILRWWSAHLRREKEAGRRFETVCRACEARSDEVRKGLCPACEAAPLPDSIEASIPRIGKRVSE